MGLVQKKQKDSGEELTTPEKVKPEKVQKVKKEKVAKRKTGDAPDQQSSKLDRSKLKLGWNKTKAQLKKQNWKNVGGTTFTQIKKANPVKSVGVKLFFGLFCRNHVFCHWFRSIILC